MGKTELRIDADLVARARDAGLPVERFTENGLRRALAEAPLYRGLTDAEKAHRWLEAQRSRIEAHGTFSNGLRNW